MPLKDNYMTVTSDSDVFRGGGLRVRGCKAKDDMHAVPAEYLLRTLRILFYKLYYENGPVCVCVCVCV